MAGPDDEVAAGAGGDGHMRASSADREQVIDVLKGAFVQGRLDEDELDTRVGQALASRTYAELAVLTADIPVGARPREPGRNEPGKKLFLRKAVAATTGATAVLCGLMYAMSQIPVGNPLGLPVALAAVLLMMVVPTAWLVLFHAWLDDRADRRASAARSRLSGPSELLGPSRP